MAVEITRMDHNGKVVIPRTLRDKFNLQAGEPFFVADVNGRIVFSSARGESVQSEFISIVDEFDRRLTKVDHGIDPVELVRQLRATQKDY